MNASVYGGNSFLVYHGIICCSALLPLLHYHCQYSRTSFYVLKRNLIKILLSEFCSLTDSPKEYNTWVAEFYFFMISISTALSKIDYFSASYTIQVVRFMDLIEKPLGSNSDWKFFARSTDSHLFTN